MIFINRSTASTSRNNLLFVSGQRHNSDRFNLFQTYSALEATNLSTLVAAKFTFPLITEVSTIEICLYSLHRKEAFTGLRKEKKMIGHRARLQENDDLPRTRAKPKRKSSHFLNVCELVRALIVRKSMRSKDAQCKTEA